jgi:hypothetical protein
MSFYISIIYIIWIKIIIGGFAYEYEILYIYR